MINEMIDITSVMKYSFSYQHKNLIFIGIIKFFFLNLLLFIVYIGIELYWFLSSFFEFLLFLIIFTLLESISIFFGVYDIRQARKEIKLEIDGIHIRKYIDEKLKIEIIIDDLKKIVHIYPDTNEWREIVFVLLNKKKIKLTISEKKELPKFEEFFKFLVYYSKKYNIQFEEKEMESSPIFTGF